LIHYPGPLEGPGGKGLRRLKKAQVGDIELDIEIVSLRILI